MGFVQPSGEEGIIFREWAPGAREASLVGDFNGWDVSANPCVKDDFVCVYLVECCVIGDALMTGSSCAGYFHVLFAG